MHTVIDDAVHRLRAVPAGLPGRLHRAGAGERRAHRLGGLERRRRPTRRASATRVTGSASTRPRANDERLAAERGRRAGSKPIAAALAARRAPRRAGSLSANADRPTMKRRRDRAFFATLRDANPRAGAASSSTRACSSCSPPCCCRRRRPTSASTRRRAACSPIAPTPQKMLALGLPALDRAHQHDRPVPQQGEEPDRDLPHPGRAAWRPGAAHARGARGAARRRPQDGQRGAERRLRRADDGGRHARLSRRATAPAWRRASTPLEVETALLERVPAALPGRRPPLADPARPLRLPGAQAAVRGLRGGALVRLGPRPARRRARGAGA